MITYYIPTKALEKLKQKARNIKRERNIPHHEALEIVAQEAGLQNWHQVTNAVDATKPAERAFTSGCVIAMDMKQGQDFNSDDGIFIEDQFLCFYAQKTLYENFINAVDEYDDRNEPDRKRCEIHSEDELREWFGDEMDNTMFFRLTKADVDSIKELLMLVRERSFWPPRFVWIKGEFFDTYDLPAVDDGNQVIGVRFI